MKKYPWLIPALIFVSCAFVLGLWLDRITPPPKTAAVAAPQPRRDFSLTDTSGQKVNLATYQGKWVLVFFGFLNCPDACPTAMLNVATTLRELGPMAEKIQPIFITIDPERDTPSLMKDYLKNFSEGIVGLSGTAEETTAIAAAYGVYYKKRAVGDADYTMDHSTAFYLISPQGEFIRPYKPDLDPTEFSIELSKAINLQ